MNPCLIAGPRTRTGTIMSKGLLYIPTDWYIYRYSTLRVVYVVVCVADSLGGAEAHPK